jgi:branched-chain amino acid transport system substrate-binding protein
MSQTLANKKILAVLLVIIVIAAAGAGIYYYTTTTQSSTTSMTGVTSVAAATNATLPPLKIGVLTPLSPPGDYLSGHLILGTAQLYVKWLNSQGGVTFQNGTSRMLALDVADETLDPTVAISALQRMVTQDGIVGLIGPWESGVALPVAAATQNYPVNMFVTYTWADNITLNHYKYVFRVGVYNSLIAGQSIDFFKYEGWKNIVVMVEESSYGFGQEAALKYWAPIKYPGVKFTFIPVEPGKADYSTELSQVQALAPDALVLQLNVPAIFTLAKQAVDMGLTSTGMKIYFGNDCPTWDPTSFWQLMGTGGVGTMFPTYYSPAMHLGSVGQQFLQLYHTAYNATPGVAMMWYWDSLRILTQAIEQTGSTNPDVLSNAIANVNIQGTTGNITFQNNPDPTSLLWHQWIGETQYTFNFTQTNQIYTSAQQLYPPLNATATSTQSQQVYPPITTTGNSAQGQQLYPPISTTGTIAFQNRITSRHSGSIHP